MPNCRFPALRGLPPPSPAPAFWPHLEPPPPRRPAAPAQGVYILGCRGHFCALHVRPDGGLHLVDSLGSRLAADCPLAHVLAFDGMEVRGGRTWGDKSCERQEEARAVDAAQWSVVAHARHAARQLD
jgi:hypothetical protein